MNENDSVHTVTIAIIAHRTHVLLLQRNPDEYEGHGDKWELIGGHIQVDEWVEHAVLREVAEETGITGLSPEFVNILPFTNGSGREANNWIYVAFVGDELPMQISPEHIAYEWIDIREALWMPLACRHNAILRDIVQRFL